MPAPSPPPPPPPLRPKIHVENQNTPTNERRSGDTKVPVVPESPSPSVSVSPLKAAADLIQTLDLAYAEMTHCAADAARDAEQARRNARTASEIARRYIHRSYPKVSTSFGSPLSAAVARPEESKEGSRSPLVVESHGTGTTGSTNDYFSLQEHNSKPPTPNRPDSSSRKGAGSSSSSSPGRNHTNNNNNRVARNFHTPSSADRIAQSHAEDVLTLSMELERSKNALKSEQKYHDETKVALSNQKMKASSLEEENKRLRQQLQQLDRERDEKIWNLEHELAKAKLYVEAAEEDAQLALDLAKESSEKRDEMEDELERVMEELQTLKEQPPPQLETPRRSVRFANDSSSSRPEDTTKVEATPQNADTGELLLRRPQVPSPAEEVMTPRMQRKQDDDSSSPLAIIRSTSSSSSQHQSPSPRNYLSGESSEDCKNAAKLIQDSGRRLDLAGHWWRKGHENPVLTHEMEAMARQYCQSVEFKVDRQQKEIKELESLCGFLEKKLVTGSEEP